MTCIKFEKRPGLIFYEKLKIKNMNPKLTYKIIKYI